MTALGRNDKCECGSGKKYKHCCMQREALQGLATGKSIRDISQLHRNAMVCFQSGNLTEAEILYRQILQFSPDHPDALYFSGLIAHQSGNDELAVEFISRVIAVCPPKPEYYHDLGVSLQKLGRHDEALASFRQELSRIKNWNSALYYLTRPLVLTTGLDSGSPPTISRTQNSTQPVTSPDSVIQNNASYVATTEMKIMPGAGHSLQSADKLRIMLIYPPPWKILPQSSPLVGMPFGLPKELSEREVGGDFQIIPYGLLTIAAQARRAGHEVSLNNLSVSAWHDVVKLIVECKADIFGISAFTANRRGLGAVAALIRQYHPHAHITAGGPFVTALPADTLRYYREIDTAVIGEGEATFMELLELVGSGRTAVGIPGIAWRDGDHIVIGPVRQRVSDLDGLASPFDYFTSRIVITSRGCPSKCTFCGSFTTWGRKLRLLSAESCIDTIRKALARLPIPFIGIKDDTFTADRRRTMAICDTIIESRMNFLWSCDTRVDCLDEELLQKMRLAGCQMISIGVESGAPEILKSIGKETNPEMVLRVTRSAQKFGISVRYYMILLTRGETMETLQQSIDLIKAGRPNHYIFSPMSYCPGTEEWASLCAKQGLTPDIFFKNDFKELSCATNRQKEFDDLFLRVTCDIGAIDGFKLTVEERTAIVARLPNLHSVHVELANAYYDEQKYDEALAELDRAEALGYPVDNVIANQRACIALLTGDVDHALVLLERAVQSYPDLIVTENLKKLRGWAGTNTFDQSKPVLNDSVYAIDFSAAKVDTLKIM